MVNTFFPLFLLGGNKIEYAFEFFYRLSQKYGLSFCFRIVLTIFYNTALLWPIYLNGFYQWKFVDQYWRRELIEFNIQVYHTTCCMESTLNSKWWAWNHVIEAFSWSFQKNVFYSKLSVQSENELHLFVTICVLDKA